MSSFFVLLRVLQILLLKAQATISEAKNITQTIIRGITVSAISVTMVGEVTVGGDDIIGDRSDLSSSASMEGGADDIAVVVVVVDTESSVVVGVVIVVVERTVVVVVVLRSNTLIGSIG